MKFLSERLFLATALERSQKFHIIKFKTLLANLILLDKEDYFDNSKQNYLGFIAKLKSKDLIENGSDFFWSLIHRLTNAIKKNEKTDIERTYIYFLQNSFDSFYTLLPAGAKLVFKGLENKNIILPKLGISLDFYSDSDATINKISDNVLEYKLKKFEGLKDSSYYICIDNIPIWFSLKKEIVCARINIFYQSHENIFEEHYYHNCCETIFLGHLLKKKIEKAFDKIKLTDEKLYLKLTSSIDNIIPYGNDINKKYPNFAIATLKKTIFLSIDLLVEHEVFIAECIIHEYSHCELHLVQDTVLLTNIENNILEYYSPWRKDPRHLLGLIHAIYISHELISFYYTLLQNNKGDYSDEIIMARKRIEIIIHQIRIALKQIRPNQLTDFSKEIMTFISESTREISENLAISSLSVPFEILEHMESWKSNNRHLVIVN